MEEQFRGEADESRIEPALNLKHGYPTMQEYKRDAQKRFSLLEMGIIQKPSTRLLLINVDTTTFCLEVVTDNSLGYSRWLDANRRLDVANGAWSTKGGKVRETRRKKSMLV